MHQSSFHSLPPVYGSPTPNVTVAHAARVRLLRRSFQRQFLRRRPTRLEAAALDRAALLTALAEALANDPQVHPDSVTRADGAAARARAALAKLRTPQERAVPSLGALLARDSR
jgi:hypothetical protein